MQADKTGYPDSIRILMLKSEEPKYGRLEEV